MSSAEQEIRAVADLSARRTREQAWRRFGAARSAEEFCSSWLAIQAQAIGGVSDGVVVLQKPGGAALVPVAFLPEPPVDRARLAQVTERALKEQQGVVVRLPEDRCQLAHPVEIDGALRGVVGLELEPRGDAQVRAAMRDLQWGSGWLEVLLRRHADPQEAVRLRLKLALDLLAALLEHRGLAEGGAAFVTELATRLCCDRVALGVRHRGHMRVRALSHSGHFDDRASLVRALELAMDEAGDQASRIVHPARDDAGALVTLAHAQLLRESGAGAVLT